jgi:hypothetical protein
MARLRPRRHGYHTDIQSSPGLFVSAVLGKVLVGLLQAQGTTIGFQGKNKKLIRKDKEKKRSNKRIKEREEEKKQEKK